MKSTLDELLQRANILDVVSQYVKLKKAGKDYAGLCPFHKEKTPSFTVSVEKQMFYCFSCREGGNAINFLMKYESLSFQEAVENLARQYGVQIEKRDSGRRTGSFDALSKLAEYYQRNLKNSKVAVQYLKNRGIGIDTIDEFQLGYSDKTSGNLKGFLKLSGVPNDIFLSTGIVRMKDTELYDMFRGRIIIPILDVNKRVIGFGGRTMEKDGFPKYVNSPESSVFSKRTALFGIDKTRKEISEKNEVFIVEGYFDFISLYMNGFKNIAATLGTSVTELQVSKLRNYTENITLMLDGDEAGVKSALRLIEMFAEMEVNGSMVVLPEGHDPDSLVRKEGIERVYEATAKKKPILDYYVDYYAAKLGVKTPESKMALIRASFPYIKAIRNSVTRRLYIKRLSELTGVEEHHFAGPERQAPTGLAEKSGESKGIIEKKVINACVANPYLLESFREKEVLRYIKDEHVREVLSRMLAYVEKKEPFELQRFVQMLDDESLRSFVLDATFDSVSFSEDESEKVLFDYFSYVERQFLREELKRLTEKISAAEKRGDEREIVKLQKEKGQVLASMKKQSL
ncbi:MAG TPA: DNA primase [Syntrophorhabdaceae bacterium]|nr:DNA primase [Syntrophorhabdaceae bacterium]